MSCLWEAVALGLDDEIVRIQVFRFVSDDKGADAVRKISCGTRKIFENLLEDVRSTVLRGQDALYVLHDEDRWSELANNPQVFLV